MKTKTAPPTKNAAAQALGRLGGSRNTPAQRKARAANAKFAGRPGRICSLCHKPVFGGHKDKAQDAKCHGREWMWLKQSEKIRS